MAVFFCGRWLSDCSGRGGRIGAISVICGGRVMPIIHIALITLMPYSSKKHKKSPLQKWNGPCVDIFHCALANAANYIFLPTLVFFATGAAFTAVALGALGALAFTTVASSTASVFFVDLRERRVLGLASSVETTLPNV